jgi:hypothetical protein
MTEITADERLEKIANKSLELLQENIEKGPSSGYSADRLIKDTGEALKALAEGIDAYKKAMRKTEIIYIPQS